MAELNAALSHRVPSLNNFSYIYGTKHGEQNILTLGSLYPVIQCEVKMTNKSILSLNKNKEPAIIATPL